MGRKLYATKRAIQVSVVLLGTIVLTQLNGRALYVEGSRVDFWRDDTGGHCKTGTAIVINNRVLCVKETVEEIEQKRRDAK